MRNPSKDKTDSTTATFGSLVWVFAGTGGQIAMKLVVLVVLARLLTPDKFGLFTIAMIVLTFMQYIGRLGVGLALVQKAEIDDDSVRAGIALSLLNSLSVAVLVFLAAPSLATFFERDELTPVFRVLIIAPLLQSASQVSEALLQREMAFRKLTIIEAAGHFLGYGAISIGLAVQGLGVWALVAGVIGQEVIRTILLLWAHRITVIGRYPLSAALDLLRFSGLVSLVQIVNALSYQLDNLVVAKTLGTQAVGTYGRAYQVLTVPTKLLGNSLLKVLFPAMSKVQNDPERLERAFSLSLGVLLTVTVPTSTFFAIFAPEIVYVLLGDQWGDAVLPFRILALVIAFRVGHKLCEAILRARARLVSLLITQMIYAASVLGFAYAGSAWGLAGVAVGVGLAATLNFTLLLGMVLTSIDIRTTDILLRFARPSVISLILAACMLPLSAWAHYAQWHPAASLVIATTVSMALAGLILRYLPFVAGNDLAYVKELVLKRYFRRGRSGSDSGYSV